MTNLQNVTKPTALESRLRETLAMTLSSPPPSAGHGELVRWSMDVLNSHDLTPLRACLTETTVERFPQETCTGPDAIVAYFERAFAALPDFHLTVVSLAEQGDDVFVQWTLTGTHSGAPFRGIAPTGRRLSVDGMDHFVVREGRIVSNFVVYDQLQFALQIGLMPPEGSAPDRALKGLFNAKARLLAGRR